MYRLFHKVNALVVNQSGTRSIKFFGSFGSSGVPSTACTFIQCRALMFFASRSRMPAVCPRHKQRRQLPRAPPGESNHWFFCLIMILPRQIDESRTEKCRRAPWIKQESLAAIYSLALQSQ